MEKFNLKDYLERLEQSEKMSYGCKPPMPNIADQDYVFISYSHADYKRVYSDLAHMYCNGVRFWYDRDIEGGEDWDSAALRRIRDPHCSGVIFYLSKSFFQSRPITMEIMATCGLNDKGERETEPHNYFAVNLVDGKKPADIIRGISLEKVNQMGYEDEWYITMLEAFRGKAISLNYSDSEHKNELIKRISADFNVIGAAIGENGLYEGEWREGKYYERRGKYTFEKFNPRESYEGEWVGDEICGRGTMKWRNGAVYVGEWLNNMRNGKGKYLYSEGNKSEYYDGEWESGKICGYGKMKWRNGDVYVGEWLNNMRNGKGKYLFSKDDDREYYDGEWEQNKKHGYGEMKWRSGAAYIGEWLNGEYHGKGKLTCADGSYEGNWNQNLPCGDGVITLADGESAPCFNGVPLDPDFEKRVPELLKIWLGTANAQQQ